MRTAKLYSQKFVYSFRIIILVAEEKRYLANRTESKKKTEEETIKKGNEENKSNKNKNSSNAAGIRERVRNVKMSSIACSAEHIVSELTNKKCEKNEMGPESAHRAQNKTRRSPRKKEKKSEKLR